MKTRENILVIFSGLILKTIERPNGALLLVVIMLWILLLVVEATMLLAAAHIAFAGIVLRKPIVLLTVALWPSGY
uniref:Uncharacterized protein n=1 Tax=Rhizophora mucronata TaxID=61149 RepID=A0A2P2LQM1_RHIMU